MASNVKNAVEEGKQVPRIQIYSSSATGVSQFWRGFSLWPHFPYLLCCSFCGLNERICFRYIEKYERDAKKYWDVFYKQHQDKVGFPIRLSYSLSVDANHEISYLGKLGWKKMNWSSRF